MSWDRSWRDFIVAVRDFSDRGASEAELAEHFGGAWVEWKGVVTRVNLTSQDIPGITFEMPEVKVPLNNGYEICESHLYLLVRREDASLWQGVSGGDEVAFRGQIKARGGPFSPIKVVCFDEDNSANVQLSIGNGEPLPNALKG